MKHLAIVTALIGSLALAGCAGGVIPGTTVAVPTIAQVQAATATACSFVPTATTIANIIAGAAAGGAGAAIASTAGSIAQAICAALAAVPQADSRFGTATGAVSIKVGDRVVPIVGTYLVR